jgi:hypothetical protein
MSLSCYIFFLQGENCFVTFELTDSIAEKLDGNALNLVKPLGWVGIGLFVAASVLLKVYYVITARITNKVKSGELQHKNREMKAVIAMRKASLGQKVAVGKAGSPNNSKTSSGRLVAVRNVRSII